MNVNPVGTGSVKSSVKGACSHSHSKKVKSGAEVNKRPVKRTELWPHTIAVEEDGKEVNSENINLATFYTCFTYIQERSKGAEFRGRTVLLYSISKILRYMQWAEARVFHNLMMTKIEQERISWKEDFEALANDFIDKKVRSNLRIKQTSSAGSGGSSYRPGSSGRGRGGGFRGSQSNSSGRGKPLYGAVCWQWNSGDCTYGADCKRWHVCKTCAEAGKLGEKHKASSHERSDARPRQQV